MALYHRATITPSKPEVVASWAATRSWCSAEADDIEVIGAFRFDDPEGSVGMETFVAHAADTHLLVPLTYRDAPSAEAAAAFIGTVEHTVLGTRWVYDGLGDPTYVRMLAAVSVTGQGEALGMVEVDGRWVMAPTNVRIRGGDGWGVERVPIDGFEPVGVDGPTQHFRNDGFDLTVHRHLSPGPQPTLGLTGTWPGAVAPVVISSVARR